MNRLFYEIIGAVILILGTWFGSGIYRDGVEKARPPKYQTIINNQSTENKNTSIQSSSQAQISTTIVTTKTQLFYNINYNGKTNFSYTKSATTNTTKKTN